MKFGFHVMIRDGIDETLTYGASRGCETIQVFSSNPRQWGTRELLPGKVDSFLSTKLETGIDPVFFHSIYLVNLASPSDVIHRKSMDSLVWAIKAADALDVAGVITHIGNHKGWGEAFGISRVANAVGEILDKAPGKANLILETTAGAGTSIGHRFEQLAEIIRLAGKPERVSVCFDTCHVFSAGYDISGPTGLAGTLEEFDRHVGLSLLETIHANDSRGECGSRRDRHEHIGEGKIGLNGFRALVNHPYLSHLPCILETPFRGEEDDTRNLETLRYLVE